MYILLFFFVFTTYLFIYLSYGNTFFTITWTLARFIHLFLKSNTICNAFGRAPVVVAERKPGRRLRSNAPPSGRINARARGVFDPTTTTGESRVWLAHTLLRRGANALRAGLRISRASVCVYYSRTIEAEVFLFFCSNALMYEKP